MGQKIETDFGETEITASLSAVYIEQGEDLVLINHAAVPALIEALQAAAREAGDE